MSLVEKYEHMCGTEGWKLFVEDMKINADTLFPNLMQRTAGENDLWFAKGRYDVYKYILGFEQMTSEIKAHLELQMNPKPEIEDDYNELNSF